MVAVGDILSSRYLLEAELGSGGMGVVYRTMDLRTGGTVAIKMPHALLLRDPQFAERFKREALIAVNLLSTRIARVTDVAEADGMPYLVMDYVPGESLSTVLAREGALPPLEAVRIAIEVARALQAAAERGIVHRDVKPANIHILPDGDVKVLDFGVAQMTGMAQLTAASMFVGTPEYAAPERAEGMGDTRSDIYSLGVTIYESLTGAPPFRGTTPWTTIRKQIAEPPPALPAAVPVAVSAIVMRCLAKDPDDRYQTPRALVEALQRVRRALEREADEALADDRPPQEVPPQADGTLLVQTPAPEPIIAVAPALAMPAGGRQEVPDRSASPPREVSPGAAAPPEPPPRGEMATRRPAAPRRPPTAALVGAGGVLLLVVLAALFLLNRGNGRPTRVSEPTPAVTGEAEAPLAGNQEVTPTPSASPAVAQPAATSPADPLAGARPGEAAPIVFQRLVNGKWQIFVMDGNGGNQRRLITSSADDLHPAFSPDGSRIAFESNRDGPQQIYVMNADGSDIRRLTMGTSNDRSPAWRPDGSELVFVSDRDGRDHLWVAPAGGGEPRPLTSGGQTDGGASWSPDGRRIAYHSSQGTEPHHLFVIDAAGGQPRQITSGPNRDVTPAWSPDGKQLAFASYRDSQWNIYVMEADGANPRKLASDFFIQAPDWSPDGKQIVYHANADGGQPQLFVVPATGGTPRRLTGDAANSQNPSWPLR